MDVQVCSDCGLEKLLTEFPRNGRDKFNKVRYRTDCKVCYNIKRKISKKKLNKFLNNTKHRTGELNTYSLDDWKDALIFFRGECAYCGRKQSRRVRLTKDHIKPVSKDGPTSRRNILPACTQCNCSKSDDSLEKWYPRQLFFSIERLERIKEWRKDDAKA